MEQSLFEEYPHVVSQAEVLRDLGQQGYANIPGGVGRAACQELFAEFKSFVDLCQESGGDKLQESLAHSVNNKGNGDYFMKYRVPGQINTNESGDRAPGKDHKYIYHHGALSTRKAREVLGTELPKTMASFLEKCDDMYHHSRKTTRFIGRLLGIESILFSGALVDDVHHLRLIDYVASDEDMLGEAHFDRSLGTIAEDEDSTGLLGGPGQNGYLLHHPDETSNIEPYPTQLDDYFWQGDALKPVEHVDGISKFFLGAGINRLKPADRSRADGQPLLGHSIRNDHPGQARKAAVFFINPHNKFRGYVIPTKFETGFGDIQSKLQKLAA